MDLSWTPIPNWRNIRPTYQEACPWNVDSCVTKKCTESPVTAFRRVSLQLGSVPGCNRAFIKVLRCPLVCKYNAILFCWDSLEPYVNCLSPVGCVAGGTRSHCGLEMLQTCQSTHIVLESANGVRWRTLLFSLFPVVNAFEPRVDFCYFLLRIHKREVGWKMCGVRSAENEEYAENAGVWTVISYKPLWVPYPRVMS